MKKFYDVIESIIISLVVILILILFVFRSVSVDGDSMLPSFHHGDRLIITNMFYTPKKGDVVVVDKNTDLKKPLIKRVIATEGDTIKIEASTGNVYVNGNLLQEDYIYEKINSVHTSDINITIEEGHVFVMGDNRNNSTDSRSESLGQVDTKNILGKVIFQIYPFEDAGVV